MAEPINFHFADCQGEGDECYVHGEQCKPMREFVLRLTFAVHNEFRKVLGANAEDSWRVAAEGIAAHMGVTSSSYYKLVSLASDRTVYLLEDR